LNEPGVDGDGVDGVDGMDGMDGIDDMVTCLGATASKRGVGSDDEYFL